MAVGTFTITELDRLGREKPDGERFEWTSDRTPQDPARGGARAAPRRPWGIGGKLRRVRTDYGGSDTPSEQVLGPKFEDQSLRGKWDDRYNFAGYAVAEMRRFEALCNRGNLVRVQFQDQAFVALIADWRFDYHRSWDIGYRFTLSVHRRPDEFDLSSRSPATLLSTSELFDAVNERVIRLMAAQARMPISGNEAREISAAVDDVTAAERKVAKLLDSIEGGIAFVGEQTDRAEGLVSRGTAPFLRLATQFRQVGAAAARVVTLAASLRSDAEFVNRTAIGLLDFEDWKRSLTFHGRVLMGRSSESAAQAEARAEPAPTKIYRPSAGESLYHVSRRFYGTPHNWHLIAERNGLEGWELTGDEILVIPERGQG